MAYRRFSIPQSQRIQILADALSRPEDRQQERIKFYKCGVRSMKTEFCSRRLSATNVHYWIGSRLISVYPVMDAGKNLEDL